MGEIGNVSFFDSNTIDPAVLFTSLGIVVAVVALFTYLSYRYQKWRRYQEFITEMQSMDLNPDQEGTLAAMVKRHNMDQPVTILFSKSLYDEMASKEMVRILASPGTAEAKAAYIEALYDIRTKTYMTGWEESAPVEETATSYKLS